MLVDVVVGAVALAVSLLSSNCVVDSRMIFWFSLVDLFLDWLVSVAGLLVVMITFRWLGSLNDEDEEEEEEETRTEYELDWLIRAPMSATFGLAVVVVVVVLAAGALVVIIGCLEVVVVVVGATVGLGSGFELTRGGRCFSSSLDVT